MDIELVLEAKIASGFTICAEKERPLMLSISAEQKGLCNCTSAPSGKTAP